MLNSFDVVNARGASLTFDMFNNSNGYTVDDIQGLGPVKAELVSSGYAQMDGTHHQTAQRGERNIVIMLGLDSGGVAGSVELLRQNLYNYFRNKAPVTLRFRMMSGLEVSIQGRVEDMVPVMFTAEPKMQISIVCNLPDFIAPGTQIVNLTTTANTSGAGLLPLQYGGTESTGIKVQLTLNRAVTQIILRQQAIGGGSNHPAMTFSYNFLSGDIFRFSTIPNQKSVEVVRGGSGSSILYALDPTSPWIQLEPGENNLRMIVPGGADLPYTIEHDVRYGGL